MKRISLLSFFFAVSFLNMGFINKFQTSDEPKIKGIICGTELYMNVLKENFPKEEIFSYEAEDQIYDEFDNKDGEYFYRYIFNVKNGMLFEVDEGHSNAFITSLRPLYKEEWSDGSYSTFQSKKIGNFIEILTDYYDKGHSKIDSYKDKISLSKLTNSFVEEGKEVTHNCIDFPLPGTLDIKKLLWNIDKIEIFNFIGGG